MHNIAIITKIARVHNNRPLLLWTLVITNFGLLTITSYSYTLKNQLYILDYSYIAIDIQSKMYSLKYSYSYSDS